MRVVDIARGVVEVDLKQLKQDKKERSCIGENRANFVDEIFQVFEIIRARARLLPLTRLATQVDSRPFSELQLGSQDRLHSRKSSP